VENGADIDQQQSRCRLSVDDDNDTLVGSHDRSIWHRSSCFQRGPLRRYDTSTWWQSTDFLSTVHHHNNIQDMLHTRTSCRR